MTWGLKAPQHTVACFSLYCANMVYLQNKVVNNKVNTNQLLLTN